MLSRRFLHQKVERTPALWYNDQKGRCKMESILQNDAVSLIPMTLELCHIYYQNFQSDEAIYMDMSKFAPYRYKKENEVFATLEKVVDRLCDTICSLSNQVISNITGRDWIIKSFN